MLILKHLNMKRNKIPNFFLCDVDGVLTTGQYLYDIGGKKFKIFGPDDKDLLNILKNYIDISFITSDQFGYSISKKRVKEMGFKLNYVPTLNRYQWVKKNFDLKKLIFMGDGFNDVKLIRNSYFSICPQNSFAEAKKYSTLITKNKGGERAVAEACIYILSKFFKKKIENLI